MPSPQLAIRFVGWASGKLPSDFLIMFKFLRSGLSQGGPVPPHLASLIT